MRRYYNTQRPFGPGTFPRQNGTETITNFGGKIYCEEIDREAADYELTAAGTSGRVREGTYNDGTPVAFVDNGP